MEEKCVYAQKPDSCCAVCDATVMCTLKTNGTSPWLYFSPIQLHLVCDFFFYIGTFNIKMWFAKEYGEHFLEFRTSALFLGGGIQITCLFTQLLEKRRVINLSLPMEWITSQDIWKYVKLKFSKSTVFGVL